MLGCKPRKVSYWYLNYATKFEGLQSLFKMNEYGALKDVPKLYLQDDNFCFVNVFLFHFKGQEFQQR